LARRPKLVITKGVFSRLAKSSISGIDDAFASGEAAVSFWGPELSEIEAVRFFMETVDFPE
jgi:hypothetical protein